MLFSVAVSTHLCVCHHICRPKSLFQGHVAVGILLLYLCCSLSLSQFQPIFVFVPISAVLSHCFKDMSLLVFYYNFVFALFCVAVAVSTHLCVVCHHICRPKSLFQGHVTVGILLLYLHFSLSLSQFQPIFVLFVKISAILSLCF